jgi:hypothetical protein
MYFKTCRTNILGAHQGQNVLHSVRRWRTETKVTENNSSYWKDGLEMLQSSDMTMLSAKLLVTIDLMCLIVRYLQRPSFWKWNFVENGWYYKWIVTRWCSCLGYSQRWVKIAWSKVLEDLEALGLDTKGAAGKSKPTTTKGNTRPGTASLKKW